ncbi:sorting and assembly machinery component 50 homolog [Gigantopelta aegis]|uniref:sorting and assembly machinery component 50 homolog n=1 Tax=Gigantopelta aegis TaxID=1735272 RepID=UPI001B88BF95|nr:sorting and assembly machinery component 50 homolog [Gigantopelta aegis]
MGTVHAKEPLVCKDLEAGSQKEKTIDLDNIPVHVQRVVVDGVSRTKNDIIVSQVQELLAAKSFSEMVFRSNEVKLHFEQLGLFKNIHILIDTYKGECARDNAYEVKFDVNELRCVAGGINTMVGNTHANLLFSLRLPNMNGRGERLNVEYSHGTKQSRGVNMSFTKPIFGLPEALFSTGFYQHHSEYPWSGYKETDRGMFTDVTFPTVMGNHTLKWEGVWRDLRSLTRTTSFAVREQSGHSIKSCLKHIFYRDTRDDAILPTRGTLLRAIHEYAGLGGSANFFKHDLELQVNQALLWDTVLQFSFGMGIMKSLDTKKEILVNDRFFLGGPLTLRGFNIKGVGPHSDGNALGAEAYWIVAGHIYTPLPFRPLRGGFGDLFKLHFFANAGNIGNIALRRDFRENIGEMMETIRWAYGAGLVLRMGGIARLELNYVVPVVAQRGDGVYSGLQFGIGLSFM